MMFGCRLLSLLSGRIAVSDGLLEDLSNISNGPHHRRPKGQRRNNFSRILSRALYQKLEKVLAYKLPAVGLPAPIAQHAAFTSTTCRKCFHCAKENRPDQATFRCVKCNHEEHADENAGSVIGLKGLWWTEIRPTLKKGVKMMEDQKFIAWCERANQRGFQ